ncbi:hypothetical protein TrRE_jg7057, partial [Triparma retinervis]
MAFEGCGKGTKLKDKTLLVESTCSDGICREATAAMEGRWGGAYRIGGLSGFPFGGRSAVKEVAKQAPEGGDVFLMYAPHVGLSSFCEIKRDVEEVAIENMKGEVAIEDNGGVVTLSRHALNKSKCANFFVLGGIIVNTPAGMPDFFAPKRFEVHTKVGGRGDCSHVRDLLGVFDAPRVERLGGLFFNVLCNEDTTDTPRVEGSPASSPASTAVTEGRETYKTIVFLATE